ncbi:recombinase family protein [Paenibacillus polymyxa]|uniref:recombinase family protein n=1 Tax=Paenibacillus polymyxa TaxID=1406 RepID=UPI001FEED880|nr:recombinase family protein [Paenibacillus polymyxa]
MIGIYPRVSTDEQARTGFSIDFQIREGKKKAGTDDVKIYSDEGYSGEFLERPGLTQLRKDVKAGIITKVICLDPDRLARKLMLQLIITDEFERSGAELIFINGDYAKTPEGQLFYSMRGAIAEFEKDLRKQRLTNV